MRKSDPTDRNKSGVIDIMGAVKGYTIQRSIKNSPQGKEEACTKTKIENWRKDVQNIKNIQTAF